MRKTSFTSPISFWRAQIGCLWSQRGSWILGILVLIVAGLAARHYYRSYILQQQVSQLETYLINFDQDVREQQVLRQEQLRLTQKLQLCRETARGQSYQDLSSYLLALADLIPAQVSLTKLEAVPGQTLNLVGTGAPAQLISFWRKLLSLDYVSDGRLEQVKTDTQTQFTLSLKVKHVEDQTVIGAGSP